MRVFFVQLKNQKVLTKFEALGANFNLGLLHVVHVETSALDIKQTIFWVADEKKSNHLWRLNFDDVNISLGFRDRLSPETHVYGFHRVFCSCGLDEEIYFLVDTGIKDEDSKLKWIPSSQVVNPKFH